VEDHIVEKIQREIELGIITESQAVYFLVEIRKLLDRDRVASKPYDSIRLYSDWVVHVDLKGPRAQEIVKTADTLYPKLITETLSDSEKTQFLKLFSLNAFREELEQFLKTKDIPPMSDAGWNSFLASFLNVIEDCPLLCKTTDKTLTNVDEVVIIQDGKRAADGSPQPVIWALCFQGKHKSSFGGDPSMEDRVWEAVEAFRRARGE
jgi:hypothetical protein